MITEGNITDQERQYRTFAGLVKTYRPDIDMETITVEKTPKGNWKIYDSTGKKVCLVSKVVLNDTLIDAKGIKKCCENC